MANFAYFEFNSSKTVYVRELCIYESQVLPKGTIGDM